MTVAAHMPSYEISNHARAGQESRHNLTYWRYRDYAGIGPGAHGRRLGMRTTRHRKPENFLAAVARRGNGIVEELPLSPNEAADEALVMGLRLMEGVDAAKIASGSACPRSSTGMMSSAWLRRTSPNHSTHIRLTPSGRLVLDHILGEIALVAASRCRSRARLRSLHRARLCWRCRGSIFGVGTCNCRRGSRHNRRSSSRRRRQLPSCSFRS